MFSFSLTPESFGKEVGLVGNSLVTLANVALVSNEFHLESSNGRNSGSAIRPLHGAGVRHCLVTLVV